MQSGAYLQEIGQAGRDGEESQTILLFKKARRYVLRSMKLYAKNKSDVEDGIYSNISLSIIILINEKM